MTELMPVNIRVNVDASGVATGVSVVSNGLNQLKSQAKMTTSAFAGFKQMALGMFAGNLLTSGMMVVTEELRAMKQESIDLQVAGTRLNGALSGITRLLILITSLDFKALKPSMLWVLLSQQLAM
jgi:hypothetical protein